MGDIHAVNPVTAASLGGLRDAKVARQDESRRQQGQTGDEASSREDQLELHEEAPVADVPQTAEQVPYLESGLDLTA